jgi:hypothetical protein
VSVFVFLLVGLIVVMPAVALALLVPGWLASLVGLPIGAWLAWLAYKALQPPE